MKIWIIIKGKMKCTSTEVIDAELVELYRMFINKAVSIYLSRVTTIISLNEDNA